MPLAGFEPATPTKERPRIQEADLAAIGVSIEENYDKMERKAYMKERDIITDIRLYKNTFHI